MIGTLDLLIRAEAMASRVVDAQGDTVDVRDLDLQHALAEEIERLQRGVTCGALPDDPLEAWEDFHLR